MQRMFGCAFTDPSALTYAWFMCMRWAVRGARGCAFATRKAWRLEFIVYDVVLDQLAGAEGVGVLEGGLVLAREQHVGRDEGGREVERQLRPSERLVYGWRGG